MYRDSSKVVSFTTVDQSKQLHRVCKVDQLNAKQFMQNDFGWPSNSISAMVRASSYQEFLMLAQNISTSPKQFNLPDGCSVKDAVALCRPRSCQSPAELELYAAQLASMDMEKMDEAYLKALDNKPLEPVKPVESVEPVNE